MVTIKGIAKHVGVSPATVSRVLNHDPSITVKEATREKIFQAAKELGYRTVYERRALEQELTDSEQAEEIILIVLALSVEEEVRNPFYLSVRKGIEQELTRVGKKKVYMLRYEEHMDVPFPVKGVIVIGPVAEEEAAYMRRRFEQIVFVSGCPDQTRYDCVDIDHERVIEFAVTSFITAGLTRIAYMGSDGSHKRRQYFQETMQKKGLLESRTYLCEDRIEAGYEQMKGMIGSSQLPEAIFADGDLLALGVVQALQEERVSEVSVLSFPGQHEAAYSEKPLRVIQMPAEELGEWGARLLMERLRGKQGSSVRIILPVHHSV